MADAIGCQRSYLSRVLSTEAHLTSDHVFGLCEFLKLSESETDYLLTLHEHERAGTEKFRRRLKSRLTQMKRDHEDLLKKVKRPAAPFAEREFLYYSAWYFSAIHIGVSIPEYQTVKALSERLHLPIPLVESVLKRLESWEFVKFEGGRWKFGGQELHVPRHSPLVSLHHGNWRQRAVTDAQRFADGSIHFTVVQSMDAKIFEKIRLKMLDFVAEASRLAGPSKEERLVCLTTDFFEV